MERFTLTWLSSSIVILPNQYHNVGGLPGRAANWLSRLNTLMKTKSVPRYSQYARPHRGRRQPFPGTRTCYLVSGKKSLRKIRNCSWVWCCHSMQHRAAGLDVILHCHRPVQSVLWVMACKCITPSPRSLYRWYDCWLAKIPLGSPSKDFSVRIVNLVDHATVYDITSKTNLATVEWNKTGQSYWQKNLLNRIRFLGSTPAFIFYYVFSSLFHFIEQYTSTVSWYPLIFESATQTSGSYSMLVLRDLT